jgi:AbrB family looped-hinge helix DNA binding protein
LLFLAIGVLGLTLKLRVGRKGYIILPKSLREAIGIDEGDEVVEVRDGIVLKPVRRSIDVDEVEELLRRHVENLMKIPDRREPKPGELEESFLEGSLKA